MTTREFLYRYDNCKSFTYEELKQLSEVLRTKSSTEFIYVDQKNSYDEDGLWVMYYFQVGERCFNLASIGEIQGDTYSKFWQPMEVEKIGEEYIIKEPPIIAFMEKKKKKYMTTSDFLDRYDYDNGNFDEQEIKNIIVYGFEDDENAKLVETQYGDNGRWTRGVDEYYLIQDRYFCFPYEEGLTEYQENEYFIQPFEVRRIEKEITMTVVEWESINDTQS